MMPERLTLFADVVLPVRLPQYFTYRVPLEFNGRVQVGQRVIVQFGKKRILTAIIVKLHDRAPVQYEAKYLLDLLDDAPLVNPLQIQLWEWVAEYYLCTVGEVMNVAIPSGFKLTSQSKIQLNPAFDLENQLLALQEREQRLLLALRQQGELGYEQAADILNLKNIYATLKYLLAKQAILIFEEIQEKYQPKIVRRVRLKPEIAKDPAALEEVFEVMKGREQWETVLLKYLSRVPIFQNPALNDDGLEKSLLLAEGISPSSYKTLLKKGFFEEFDRVVSRFHEEDWTAQPAAELTLSPAQQEALGQILTAFESKEVALLHGITGSGKTEIYIELIQRVLQNGGQVLFLLPEIVLTTQIVSRLRKIFGQQLGVYHSKYSDNERVEVWKGVQDGRFNVVVGVRSSVFLPFEHLGLVIVDEEHEPSYKQYDPAPRYQARDLATVLARFHHAKTLLGSATPSIESYYLARKGKYALVKLNERFAGATLPEVVLLDTRKEKKKNRMKDEFAMTLIEQMKETLEKGQQIILFQNRRGFAPHLECDECAWVPNCPNCAVSLTYHLYRDELRCHYCGHKEASPKACVQCGNTKVKTVGMGTEKIEDSLKILLPEARVQRMDLDTTRSRYSYQKILGDFAHGQIDILVGTQMVTKGLDFDRVQLVGVFGVDRLLHFPDFRSHERTFQMVTQVSGRAGRKGEKGTVLVQTANPNHPVLRQVVGHQYEAFFARELRERHTYRYPPFTRLIKLTTRHEQQAISQAAAEQLSMRLRDLFGINRLLGPEAPAVNRIRNLYLHDLYLKLERDQLNLVEVKKDLLKAVQDVENQKHWKGLQIIVDVDCY